MRKFKLLTAAWIMSAGLGSFLMAFVDLGLDRSVGPMNNGMVVTLIIRSLCMLLFYVSKALLSKHVVDELRALHPLHASGQGAHDPINGRADITGVLRFFEHVAKKEGAAAWVLFLFYGVWLVPWLWPFQGFVIALLGALAMATTNQSDVFNVTNKKVTGLVSPRRVPQAPEDTTGSSARSGL